MLARSCLALILALLAGCASAPQAPTTSLFTDLEPTRIELPEPVPMPARPQARVAQVGDEKLMCFGSAEAVQLRERDNAGQANTEIAKHSAAAFAALQMSNAVLIEQAQQMEHISNLRAQMWADAEARRLEDRKEHRIETWVHRLLTIVLTGVAL